MTTRTPSTTVRFAPAVWILSTLLLAASIVACLTALATPELIHGPAAMVGSMRGTALVTLALGIPMPLVAMAITVAGRGGGLLVVVSWIAGLIFITYQAWMFLFAVPFNGFFLVYVVMLASGFWALVAMLTGLHPERVDATGARMPGKTS
jgi:hypothetical protein